MLRAGLTGGIGSGKSTVADLFRVLGCPTLDLDVVAREVTRPGQPALYQIADQFGSEVFTDAGELNRSKLASIVFTDPAERVRLEQILHPTIMDATEKWVQAQKGRPAPPSVIMLEIPLLFDAGLEGTVDCIVLVSADTQLREQRVVDRRGISPAEARARIAAQVPDNVRRTGSHFIIENNGSLEELREQVQEVYQKLLILAQSPRLQ